jgi:sortase A
MPLPHRESRALRFAEFALFTGAAVCAMWVTWGWIHNEVEGREQRAAIERTLATSTTVAVRRMLVAVPLAPGSPIGVLEIPRLGISEAVAEGEADDLLDVSIGHLSDTPAPWQPGNSALAAHRDTHFRPLRDIREGDEIRLRTEHGTLIYRVRDRWIVNPDELWVLEPSNGRQLTLITCYPFTYVGKAPQRFVVRADAVEG